MSVRSILEFIGGGILILFGLLFLAYLPHDFSEVSTDAIFIVFGLLFVRKGAVDRKVPAAKLQPSRVPNKPEEKSSRDKEPQNKGK